MSGKKGGECSEFHGKRSFEGLGACEGRTLHRPRAMPRSTVSKKRGQQQEVGRQREQHDDDHQQTQVGVHLESGLREHPESQTREFRS